MSDDTLDNSTITNVVAVSDPGEINRENHTWGDRLVVNISNMLAWLFPALIVAIVAQIILRGVGNNQAWLDDLQWWLYGIAILGGFAFAITTGSHVRVDILFDRFSNKRKSRIEIFGLAWLLMPFILIMTDILMHYAVSSWLAREGSDSPNGLHKLYLLKMAIPVLLLVAFIAAWSAYYRHLKSLTEPRLWKQLLFALPTTWFIAERMVYYVVWWYHRLAMPDLNPRRIPREAIFDSIIWMGLGLAVIAIVGAWLVGGGRQTSSIGEQ